jgi:hypothetical protein
MKLRVIAFGTVVAAAGVIPCLPASAATSATVPGTTQSVGAAVPVTTTIPSGVPVPGPDPMARVGVATPGTRVAVEVVTPLPRGITWRDDAFYRHDGKVNLPAGYRYRDGGVLGPDGQLVYAPDGAHEGVVVGPVQCHGSDFKFSRVDTNNFIGNIINGAFNAARAGVEAAAGIVQASVGASHTKGVDC